MKLSEIKKAAMDIQENGAGLQTGELAKLVYQLADHIERIAAKQDDVEPCSGPSDEGEERHEKPEN